MARYRTLRLLPRFITLYLLPSDLRVTFDCPSYGCPLPLYFRTFTHIITVGWNALRLLIWLLLVVTLPLRSPLIYPALPGLFPI